uniref:Oxysterol-binding protein n=1 Tax=Ditylenchus dipsaci TaxID=166011 RepID=A0A915E2N5_9BILA
MHLEDLVPHTTDENIVDFNEPLSALQRATEELEYSNLLDSAALETSDSCRRLALVAVFAVSTYSTTGTRTTKPFNPLLAETYECDRKIDKGWRSLAEQVSHHPPTMLYHHYQKKGRSLCVMPVGSTYVRFLDNDDVFVYDKVCTSSTMTNIVSGKLQTENCGDFLVFNSSTGDKCLLKFHEQGGIFSREVPKKVSGTVIDASGRPRYRIEAIWDQYANLYRLDSNQQARSEETVWMVDPLPINSAKMHNFTEFAIELNQPEAGVAPTDSRNRPDQRLMEQGIDWTTANAIKQQLEEAQRVRRRLAADKKHRPLWFVEKREEEMLDKNDVYAFTGEYWQRKEKQDWSVCPKIFTLEK